MASSQKALLLITQIELVSSTTAIGTLYGIAFTLYCLYLHVSLPQLRNDRRRQTQFMIAYSTIIMICGLYFVISNAWLIQDAYIQHGDFLGGPLMYENWTFHTEPAIAVGFVCQVVIDILTAAMQIWRLWAVWSGTRYARFVIILPLMSFLGFTALRIGLAVLDLTQTNVALIGGQEIELGTAAFALRAITILLPTILIAGFLIFESRRQMKMIGKSQVSSLYMNVVTMFVESYALESMWTLAFVILFSISHPVEQFFNDTQSNIEIIAHLLILYRVANRRTYGSQGVGASSSRGDNISSLDWNCQTTMQFGITDGNAHSSEIRPELDILCDQCSLV